jgi:hypothetical protein
MEGQSIINVKLTEEELNSFLAKLYQQKAIRHYDREPVKLVETQELQVNFTVEWLGRK